MNEGFFYPAWQYPQSRLAPGGFGTGGGRFPVDERNWSPGTRVLGPHLPGIMLYNTTSKVSRHPGIKGTVSTAQKVNVPN